MVTKEVDLNDDLGMPEDVIMRGRLGTVVDFKRVLASEEVQVYKAPWLYVVEFEYEEGKKIMHLMTEKQLESNPYRRFREHFGDTFQSYSFGYTDDNGLWGNDPIDWSAFLVDLHLYPDIARIEVEHYGCPALVFALLTPDCPYRVVEELLRINPAAANYEQILSDCTYWLNIVVTWYARHGTYAADRRSFTKEVDPEIMRLVMKTTTLKDLATSSDINGCVPIERFVKDDPESLTPQTKAVLEESWQTNLYVLTEHFEDKGRWSIKLGKPALSFCLDLFQTQCPDRQLREKFAGLQRSPSEDEIADNNDDEDEMPPTKKQKS